MAIEDVVKKAFYLGVGLADYANQKAGKALNQLRVQAQKLADEMIERGEINAEEARKLVDEFIRQAQQEQNINPKTEKSNREPRQIEIIEEDEPTTENQDIDELKHQVESLQEQLRKLKNK